VLGGVTQRFGDLSFAFLECGVAWAAVLASDLVEHWERRSPEGLPATDPALLDVAQLVELFARYGRSTDGLDKLGTPGGPPLDERNDFARTNATSAGELIGLLSGPCFFGCEADDSMVATAFSNALPEGTRLQAALSSDLGHWDVDGIAKILRHAYAHVEQGRLSERDFRDFVFVNPARLYLRANPNFFDGTPVEAHVHLAGPKGSRHVAIDDYFVGYRKTQRADDELIVAVEIPRRAARTERAYKVAKRQTDDISIVAAAFAIERDGARVTRARLAYGGVAAQPIRAQRAEAALLDGAPAGDVCAILREEFTPLSDHRSGAEYRRALAANLFAKFAQEIGL